MAGNITKQELAQSLLDFIQTSQTGSSDYVSLNQITKMNVEVSIKESTDESFISLFDSFIGLDFEYIQSDSVTVKSLDGTTTFNEGNDYELKYKLGRIKILSNGNMSDDTEYLISYKYLEPKEILIPIPATDSFKRIPVEVLKLIPGKDNVIKTLVTFDNSDKDDFLPNEYVEFDGTMKLKTDYLFSMTDNGVADYEVDYFTGKIKTLSSGRMKDGNSYSISYRYVVNTVQGEEFTASKGSFVNLSNSHFARYSEKVQSLDGNTDYIRGTDYEMDYDEGYIKVLDSGNMLSGEIYKIQYGYGDVQESFSEDFTAVTGSFVDLQQNNIVGGSVQVSDSNMVYNSFVTYGMGRIWSAEIDLSNFKKIESLEVV